VHIYQKTQNFDQFFSFYLSVYLPWEKIFLYDLPVIIEAFAVDIEVICPSLA